MTHLRICIVFSGRVQCSHWVVVLGGSPLVAMLTLGLNFHVFQYSFYIHRGWCFYNVSRFMF